MKGWRGEARMRLQEIEDVVAASSVGGNGGGARKEVATKPGMQRVLAIVLMLQFFQQASDIDSVVLYGPGVLAAAGVTSNTLLLGLNVVFGVAKASSILIAMALTARVRRRPMLLASTGGMTASLLVLGSVFAAFGGARDDAAVAAVAVAVVVAFACAFSVGIGPLAWVYSSEILPLRQRGQGASVGAAMNRVTWSP
uniref:Major facilitator superfamily (MFS) profile domain-containing protein n=1 Tax=Oryza meridionalis TaxID=40149 RepID=A0A0E0F0V8_9ORYZ